jgi:hypothetical protein
MQDRIAVIIPVRDFNVGRNQRLIRCLESYKEFTDGLSDIYVLHDDDECDIYDPILANYPEINNMCIPRDLNLMQKINVHALDIANKYKYMGFVGDDIVFRTKWEKEFIEALSSNKFVLAYANDLVYLKGELATHPFITSNMVKAVGFFGLPVITHQYFDNYWMDLTNRIGSIKFLDSIIMEHFHPVVNKEVKDVGWQKAEDLFLSNTLEYRKYLYGGSIDKDVEKVLNYVE